MIWVAREAFGEGLGSECVCVEELRGTNEK